MGGCLSSRSSRPPLLPFLSTPFANYLTPAQLETFSIYFTELHFAPSAIIFKGGDACGDYYIFVSGKAHVFTDHKFLCEKGEGDTINTTIITAAALSPSRLPSLASAPLPRHTCSMHAITASRLLYLSHRKLVEYVMNNPDTSQTLLPLFSCPIVSLSGLAFFASMPPAHLHTLSCYMLRLQALKPQETLFVEGSLGQSVYILQAGQLKAVAAVQEGAAEGGDCGGEKVLHVFKDSSVDDRLFGEIALIMDIPRTASIISLSNSIVLEWKRNDYRTFLSLSSHQTQHIQRMMKARTAEHFRKYKVPFFASIPDEKYAILASLCQVEERQAGEVIFQEGERGSQFYLIAYGQVRVTMKRKKKTDNAQPAAAAAATAATAGSAAAAAAAAAAQTPALSAATRQHQRSMTSIATFVGTLRSRSRPSPSQHQPPSSPVLPASSSSSPASPSSPCDDDTVEICRMGPGKYFGEIALVQDTLRTATVTAVSRCIILSITKENFSIFFHEAPEAISDFEVKLARYDVQIRSVLYHPIGLNFFRRHCQREYAGENVDFWLCCRDYRHLSIDSMQKQAEEQRRERRRLRLDNDTAASTTTTASATAGVAADSEFTDSDWLNEAEDASDLEFITRLSGVENYSEYVMDQVSTLFTVFAGVKSEHYSKTSHVPLSLTVHQLRSLILMLDIYVSDSMLEELCVHLQESREQIPYHHFMQHFLSIGSASTASSSSSTIPQRLIRKMYRRICEYDIHAIARIFTEVSVSKRGNLNLAEFSLALQRLGIELKGGNDGDVSLLFFRLASPLSFSTRMSSALFTLSFPIFLSFVLNHVHHQHQFHRFLSAAALRIYNTYISPQSSHQVNIRSHTLRAITAAVRAVQEPPPLLPSPTPHQRSQRLSQLSSELFNDAEEEIVDLLASDPFARFKQSELFQEFLSSAQAYVEVKAGKGADKAAAGAAAAEAGGGGATGSGDGAGGAVAEKERMRRVGEEIRRGKLLRSGSVTSQGQKRKSVLPPAPLLPALPSRSAPPPAGRGDGPGVTSAPMSPTRAAPSRPVSALAAASVPGSPSSASSQSPINARQPAPVTPPCPTRAAPVRRLAHIPPFNPSLPSIAMAGSTSSSSAPSYSAVTMPAQRAAAVRPAVTAETFAVLRDVRAERVRGAAQLQAGRNGAKEKEAVKEKEEHKEAEAVIDAHQPAVMRA